MHANAMLAYCTALLASTSAVASPLSERCTLLGTERSDSSCACLEGWRGERCSILDLEPTTLKAMKAWAPPNRTAWGGTVVADPSGT